MADLDLLTEIHTDVKYIKESLRSHIEDDDKLKEKIVFPMWNAHQQSIGRKSLWLLLMSIISMAAGWFGGGVHK